MDFDEQERKLFQNHPDRTKYLWANKNQYHQLYSGFVHDQNAKAKLSLQKNNASFKIESKLLKTGKNYQIDSTFWTSNILFYKNQTDQSNQQSFIKNLVNNPSLIFAVSRDSIRLEWRLGQKEYKKFDYNPFVSFETSKDLNDVSVTFGLVHRSSHLNFLTKFTASIMNSADFIHRARLDYVKNQIYLGFSTQITQGFNCKITKSLIGYELSPGNNFYLRFQTDNIAQLIKGKQTYQQVGIYYIRKFNQNYKFGLGVKSINSVENYLNFTIEGKSPYHTKLKIDNKLNLGLTFRKKINDSLTLSYGVGATNLFQKRFRIQTGIVLDYNA